MGRARKTYVSHDGRRSWGEALLETDHLLFRGEFRLKVSLSEITSLAARDGALHVEFSGGQASFELGSDEAESWLAKIHNPPSLLDKLGVKPDDAVCVIGVDDHSFRRELGVRLVAPARTRLARKMALIFYGADTVAALSRLPALRDALNPNGAIWVVSRKGKAATLKDTDVMAAAKNAGLVDTKVASFSPTHTALKLVIPRASRVPAKPEHSGTRKQTR